MKNILVVIEKKSKDFHSWHTLVYLIAKWAWERLRFLPTFYGSHSSWVLRVIILQQVYKVPQKWDQGNPLPGRRRYTSPEG